MKAIYKRLKAALALRVKKLGPSSLALKLGKFLLFDKLFLDLANFLDLDNFWPFDFPEFLAIFALSLPTLSSPSPSSTFSLSEIEFSGDATVFSIEINRAAILLKPWMNR